MITQKGLTIPHPLTNQPSYHSGRVISTPAPCHFHCLPPLLRAYSPLPRPNARSCTCPTYGTTRKLGPCRNASIPGASASVSSGGAVQPIREAIRKVRRTNTPIRALLPSIADFMKRILLNRKRAPYARQVAYGYQENSYSINQFWVKRGTRFSVISYHPNIVDLPATRLE